MNILDELQWRGLIEATTMPPAAMDLNKQFVFPEELQGKPLTLYCGFDPTADSLHVGSMVPLLTLRRFQLSGHRPIALAGGATGSIGDPSGKTQERQLLSRETLDANIAGVRSQLQKLLDFESKTTPAVFGLTLPLITKADGTKFGKTEAGTIWLDPARTSVYRFYQFWVRTDDRDVIRYLKYFTFLDQGEIDPLERQHHENPGGRV